MSKAFEYLPDLKIVREKPRMEAPDWPGFHESDTAILDYYENKRLLHEQHLASLKEYPAQGFGKEHEGRDLMEGEDFELVGLPTQSNHIPVTPGSLTVTAIPMKVKPSWWHDRICPDTNKECVVGFCRGACSYQEVDKHKPKEGWPVVPLTEIVQPSPQLIKREEVDALAKIISAIKETLDWMKRNRPHITGMGGPISLLRQRLEEAESLASQESKNKTKQSPQ